MRCFLGVDVGSVSTNIVLLDENEEILYKLYLRTMGKPIETIKMGLENLLSDFKENIEIIGVGTTGSGRLLAGAILGADIIKNEITAHAVAAVKEFPDVQTIIEIGGQDSKIIIVRNKVVVDFAMNTVCAAGTGSFLDRQAERLGIPIEKVGELSLMSKKTTRIAGRCAVFAESDMIHKQQMGYKIEDILRGLCQALVRNYLANVAKGKELRAPFVFQGGVAANLGIRRAFEEELGEIVQVPKYYDVMGAIGAALLAKNFIKTNSKRTKFVGFKLVNLKYETEMFECKGCVNRCEIVQIYSGKNIIGRWGDKCGKWSNSLKLERYDIAQEAIL
ncbi:MAG: acyl-CoA dehydratase activase [Thermovenabulum sp.]|uniref:acyl-CoA dehydratase activase n=1 Tax=Thermovenabulum sp. TaxID=3100335 RepID=UPI003C7B9255